MNFKAKNRENNPGCQQSDFDRLVQLCAQALCLEEMTGRPVPQGALFYAEPKRRTLVTFDEGLRALTERTTQDLRAIIASGTTPPAQYRAALCRGCSLIDLCRPQAPRGVRAWREAALAALLAEAPA
jgi:CRISPR-associated exonuclease Cas4